MTEDEDSGVQEGLAITGIKIKGVQLPESINILSGNVTYATAGELPIPLTGNVAIEGTKSVGEPVMVSPSQISQYDIEITTSDGKTYERTVTFKNTGGQESQTGLLAGTAYNVNIIFGRTPITLTASVEAWKQGSAEVDPIM